MHSIEINIPELASPEEYKKKSPQQKERYSEMKIKETIQLNTDKGITISQIEKNTYFHRNTISKHIKSLIHKGEVYQYPSGVPNGLLFSNGNLLDPIFKEDLVLGNTLFSIYIINNRMGKFLYLQEKKENLYGQLETKGGLIIPVEEAKEFFSKMDLVMEKLVKKRLVKNE